MFEFINEIIDYMKAGGIVMLPLFLISFVMCTLIVEKILFFNSLYKIDLREMIIKRISKEKEKEEEIRLSIYPYIDRHISIIKTLALISPLLGLLGTVTGMIKTFDVISVFGTGNIRLMTAGVSEALITTETGLVIAIPGIYMSKLLERKAERIKHEINSAITYARRHR